MSSSSSSCSSRLDEVKARARAEARAAAQLEIQQQVKQTLEAERAEYEEKLKNAILTERMKSEDERLIAQLYVSTRLGGVFMVFLNQAQGARWHTPVVMYVISSVST